VKEVYLGLERIKGIMPMVRSTVLLAAMGLCLAAAAPAFAGPWLNPSGSSDHFTYSNGGDLNGFFGNPLVQNDSFIFNATTFMAYAEGDGINPQQVTQGDTASVDVLANPGSTFTQMRVTAVGSYVLDRAASWVDVAASLSITENDSLFRNWTESLQTTPPFPIFGSDQSFVMGAWSGQATVAVEVVFPEPSSNMHISLSNLLTAFAAADGIAQIDAQYQALEIQLFTVPEPATLMLLSLSALVLIRRRR
jgi:hypothetical protein